MGLRTSLLDSRQPNLQAAYHDQHLGRPRLCSNLLSTVLFPGPFPHTTLSISETKYEKSLTSLELTIKMRLA